MNISNRIKEIKDKFESLQTKAWENLQNIREKENEELSKVLNFENKYVCIDDNEYIYVNEQFQHKNIHTGNPIIVLRGQGFKYEITEYADATYMNWDQFYSYEFEISEIESIVTKIKDITKDEYDKAFIDMIEKVKKEHMNFTC